MTFETHFISELIDEISMGPFGSNIKVECFVDEGIPVLNGSNLEGYELKEDSFRYVTEEKADSLNKANAYRGDVVITHRGTLGQIVFIPQTSKYDRYVISQSQFRIRCNDKILPEYLVYYFHTRIGQYKLLSNASQVGVPALARPSTTFQKIDIEIPDITTQRRIVAVLQRIHDKIAVNTAINENLEQQAKALFKAWFVDFEPFGGVMPDDWQIVPLGELCDSISKKHRFNKPELIFLNTGDVENGMVLRNNYSEVSQMPGQAKKSIAINDILYSEIRPINKHFTYVNFNADDYVVSTKLMVLRAKGISPRRLYQFLTMPDTLNELQHEAETRSGTFPQIRFENIQQLEMIVASEQIENEYSERLNTIYSMIDRNNAENQRLAALRDTLLPKLMNGEIDVSAVKV